MTMRLIVPILLLISVVDAVVVPGAVWGVHPSVWRVRGGGEEASSVEGDLDDQYKRMCAQIMEDMDVPKDIATAALGATLDAANKQLNEEAARKIVQQEIDMVAHITSDDPRVKELAQEGNEVFFCRRALAFADGDLSNARAILEADRLDGEEVDSNKARSESDDPENN